MIYLLYMYIYIYISYWLFPIGFSLLATMRYGTAEICNKHNVCVWLLVFSPLAQYMFFAEHWTEECSEACRSHEPAAHREGICT